MENEILRVSILTDKGTDIFEFLYKPLDIDFMWRSPIGFHNPSNFVPSNSPAQGYFMDYYHGGWQEIFPVGGVASKYKEAEWGLHGEVSLIPWQYLIIKDDADEVSPKFSVRTYRTPILLEKTLTLKKGQPILYIDECVTNEGNEEMDFMWGHHPAIGEPFLDEHCVIDVPAEKVETADDVYETNRVLPAVYCDWPLATAIDGHSKVDLSKIPPKSSRSMDMVFLPELEEGWYGITNTKKKAGFGMVWDKKVFPHIWYWMVFGGSYGYPWYGRTYNLALEPFTSYAIIGGFPQIIKDGEEKKIKPKAQLKTQLLALAYTGVERVTRISSDGKVVGK
jgi:hypothetical protein